uniref:Hypothetical secreted peptide n=1 Tax=Glossina morsitans morsitans TaxID=37546 RepID=D3TSH6_GLOMM
MYSPMNPLWRTLRSIITSYLFVLRMMKTTAATISPKGRVHTLVTCCVQTGDWIY